MKKILVIQSRSRQEMIDAEQGEYRRAAGEDAELSFASTLDLARTWDAPEQILEGYDGIIVGGSGEFDLDGGRGEQDPARMTAREVVARIRPLIGHMLANNAPILGVCFGHQLIAETYGGNVTNDHSQKKVGSFEVRLTEEGGRDILFSGLPGTFMAQYGHKDSITNLPAGATLLASTPQCRFSALRYGSKAYTVQFHPELTAKDVFWKLEHSPGYLPEGSDLTKVVHESPEASRIIALFIEKIV